MSNDIRTILQRLVDLEHRFPTLEEGLDADQRSVHQLPALFKPRDISTVLTKDTDPEHPMKGEFVGDSVEPKKGLVDAMKTVEEDMLSRVKRDFADYLDQLENRVKDEIVDQTQVDDELADKAKHEIEVDDPTEAEEPAAATTAVESPVKTVELDEGAVFEIYGDETNGFEIRSRGRSLPTRFANLDHADIAIQLFQKRRAQQDRGQDYIDEV